MPANSSTVMKDIGAYITGVFSSQAVTGVGGGAGDGVEDDGAFHAPPDRAQSLTVLVNYTTTLADTETFSLAVNIQDATTIGGAGVADFQIARALATTVQETASGAQTLTGVVKVRFQDLRAHRGFIRIQTTGDLSRASLDTFDYSVVAVYGGAETKPQA